MITQTPWFQRQFNFDFPIGLFPVILERLRGTVPRIREIISDLPEEILVYKSGEQWSIKEQIGHLCDLESLWYSRFDDFLNGVTTLSAADLTNARTHSANYNIKKAEELVDMFADARNSLIQRAENINETMAGLTALHPRLLKPMRLIDSLFFVAEHDDHHVAKIRELARREV